ncbi:MAG TPA: ATP synthase F1 subunit epsilon [Balneolales bacterium]|nr:ATP synthase F1 subunit epsilon [Balneolales bacterium]
MKSFKAQILTPDGPVFEGESVGVKLPGTEGSFEVLYNHANLMSYLDIGRAEVKKDSKTSEIYAISGGFVEMSNNNLILLAEAAESSAEIDVQRAETAKDRALRRMKDEKMDHYRAELALKRAINRIKVASER